MRNDIHRPSVINPADYEFVCFEYVKIESFADCARVIEERARQNAHFARTGGDYSRHAHGGNCHICGASAIYTILFYHEKTNTYIRTGGDCAEKLEMGFSFKALSAFRTSIHDALDAKAGKRKALAILEEKGYGEAFALYEIDMSELPTDGTRTVRDNEGVDVHPILADALTVRDIVGRLVQYGSISDKALDYVGALLKRIANRPERERLWAAEKEAALPCPTGRVTIIGVVLKTELRPSMYGEVLKMTVKSDDGFMAWGTAPSGLGTIERGAKVTFVATLIPSETDSKFGFFKRPTTKGAA